MSKLSLSQCVPFQCRFHVCLWHGSAHVWCRHGDCFDQSWFSTVLVLGSAQIQYGLGDCLGWVWFIHDSVQIWPVIISDWVQTCCLSGSILSADLVCLGLFWILFSTDLVFWLCVCLGLFWILFITDFVFMSVLHLIWCIFSVCLSLFWVLFRADLVFEWVCLG